MPSNNINPVVVTDKVPASSFLNKLRDQTLSNIPQGSGDIIVKQTSGGGSSFEINPDILSSNPSVNYDTIDESVYTLPIGTDPTAVDTRQMIIDQVVSKLSVTGTSDSQWWNKDAAYNVGDIVRVKTVGFAGYDTDANNVEQPMYVFPGVYVCVSPVPKNYTTEEKYTINGIDNPEIKASIQTTYRLSGVCYYPVWKHHTSPYNGTTEEPILGMMTSLLGGNGKGRYWELISLLPTVMTMCIEGINTSFLICGAQIPSDPTTVTDLR